MDCYSPIYKKIFLASLSAICFFCALFSITLSLTQPPKEKAQKLITISQQYSDKATHENLNQQSSLYLIELSQSYLLEAIKYDPYNPDIWIRLSYNLSLSDQTPMAQRIENFSNILNAKQPIVHHYDLSSVSVKDSALQQTIN